MILFSFSQNGRGTAPVLTFLNPMLGSRTDTSSGKTALAFRKAIAMDWSTASPFGVLKEHLAWLGQRQQVLARNIANADTPGYVPRDLEPLSFRDMVHRSTPPVRVAQTVSGHLEGSKRRAPEFVEREQRHAVDATPAGNAVDLEEEMAKMNETAVSHKLTAQLYRKYLGLVRMAASARG